MLKICLVSNNFDIAREPVMNDLVDVACKVEFTVKKRDNFFASQCKFSVFLFFSFRFSFFFSLVKELLIYKTAVPFCFYLYIHPKNSVKGNCNNGKSVLD